MLPIHDVVTRNGDVANAIPVIVATSIPLLRARTKTAMPVKSAKRIGGEQMIRLSTSVLLRAPSSLAAPPPSASYNGGHGQNAPLTPRSRSNSSTRGKCAAEYAIRFQ